MEGSSKLASRKEFFHAPDQLHILVRDVVPELIRSTGAGVRRRLMAWDAECLTGEETYTLAMVLTEFEEQFPGIGFHFLVIGTDGSEVSLGSARMGVYPTESVDCLPMPMRIKNLLKSRDRKRSLVRVSPQIRMKTRFRKLSLLEELINFREPMDVIFCRQQCSEHETHVRSDLLEALVAALAPGGFLFLGSDDAMGGFEGRVTSVGPGIYRKIG